MPSAEFERAIPTIEGRQSYALERTVTWIDSYILYIVNILFLIYRYYSTPPLIILTYNWDTFRNVRTSVLYTTYSCSTLHLFNSLHNEIHTHAHAPTHNRKLSAHRCHSILPVRYQRCSPPGSGFQE